jgi:hypothetical protein
MGFSELEINDLAGLYREAPDWPPRLAKVVQKKHEMVLDELEERGIITCEKRRELDYLDAHKARVDIAIHRVEHFRKGVSRGISEKLLKDHMRLVRGIYLERKRKGETDRDARLGTIKYRKQVLDAYRDVKANPVSKALTADLLDQMRDVVAHKIELVLSPGAYKEYLALHRNAESALSSKGVGIWEPTPSSSLAERRSRPHAAQASR